MPDEAANPATNVVEAIFTSALGHEPKERAAYLDRACGINPQLLERVEALLRAHEAADSFLPEQPAEDPVAILDGLLGPAGGPERTNLVPTLEQPGQKIGHYKLLQQIGEGGRGVVYMAEQTEPVKRRVAVKIIKLGMDTKQVIARFEAERQALALMDHPNIAKVHDAGATETGRPYFVMELVRGLKITDFCDDKNLSTRERLELFIQVCRAVQHAHQKGVIHRDIKPSNILVTVNDGVAVPKVIDFGIAKATSQQVLTDKTIFTAFEQFLGTPAYMSPEQAEMTSLDIDTRTDIYSLGVLLYELLTGKTPFDAKELLAAGLDEMRRTIREKEPPKPSTRLTQELSSKAESGKQKAEIDGAFSRRLLQMKETARLVRGDLDWIVMKCLEKDRARRYETANGLARDIERHLNSEPVSASPPGAAYLVCKFVRRNRVAVASGAAIAGVLVLGVVASSWQALRARRAELEQSRLRQQAQGDQKKARAEAAKSQQIAQFLKDMLEGAGPSAALGRDTTMLREVLDQTAVRVGRDLKDQPEVEAELRHTIGQVYQALGDYPKAESMARQALALRRKLWGQEHAEVADSLYSLALALWSQGKLGQAELTYREALPMRRELSGDESLEVGDSLAGLARVLRQQGRLAEAEALHRQALEIRRKLLGGEDADVADSLSGLAGTLWSEGKFEEAETLHREELAMRRKLLGNENLEVAKSLHNLASALRDQGKLEEAEGLLREAVSLRRKLLGSEHPDLAVSLQELASLLLIRHKPVEAEEAARECLAIREKKTPNHWRTPDARSLLGASLLGQRRCSEAEPLLLSGYEGLKEQESKLPTYDKPHFREAIERLVQLYEATGQPEQAAEWKEKLEDFKRAETANRPLAPSPARSVP